MKNTTPVPFLPSTKLSPVPSFKAGPMPRTVHVPSVIHLHIHLPSDPHKLLKPVP